MRCNKCGFENSEESIYCQNCNSFLEVNNQNNIVQPVYNNVENTVPEQPVYPSVETTIPEETVYPSVETTIPEETVYPSVENTMPEQPVYPSVENTILEQPMNTNIDNNVEPQVQNNPKPEISSQNITNNFNNQNSNSPIQKILENKKILGLGLLGIVIIILVIVLLPKGSKKTNEKFDLSKSDSFFIEDNGKYALFNKDGKKLTDFIFEDVDDFSNGFAKVVQDGKSKIINENGKVTVDSKNFDYFSSTSTYGLYKAEKGEESFIINGMGKKVLDLKEYPDYYQSLWTKFPYGIYYNKEKIVILNYNGDKLIEIPVVDKKTSVDVGTYDEYISIYYNGITYILYLTNGKKIIEISDGKNYHISNASDDGKELLLKSSSSSSSEKTTYIIYSNGKKYDLKDQCEAIYYLSNKTYECKKGNKEFLLDSKYELGLEVTDKAYKDEKTYVQMDSKNEKLLFYKNGKKVNEKECAKVYNKGFINKTGYYQIEGTSSFECEKNDYYKYYYDEDGNKVSNTGFNYSYNYRENGYAIIEQKDTYHVIDKKGKKVIEDYDLILSVDDDKKDNKYYIVEKDDLYGIANPNGIVVKIEYNSMERTYDDSTNKTTKFIIASKDKETVVYNAQNLKVIGKYNGSVDVEDNYIKVTTDNSYQYYTHKGKKIYEAKK